MRGGGGGGGERERERERESSGEGARKTAKKNLKALLWAFFRS